MNIKYNRIFYCLRRIDRKFERYWTDENHVSLPYIFMGWKSSQRCGVNNAMMTVTKMMSWAKYKIFYWDFVCWDLFLLALEASILKAKKFAEPLFQSKKFAEKVRKSGCQFWAIWGKGTPPIRKIDFFDSPPSPNSGKLYNIFLDVKNDVFVRITEPSNNDYDIYI